MLPKSLVTDRPLERHRLAMVSREDAAAAAHLALFQLQDRPNPEEIILGVSVLFAAMAMRCGLAPEELHTMGRRVIMEPLEGDTQTNGSIQVLKDFAAVKVLGVETSIS